MTSARSAFVGLVLVLVAAGCSRDELAPPVLRGDPPASVASGSAIRFVDVSAERGVDLEHRRSWGGTWIDHDDDGDPDLLANRHFFPPFYFDHEGGSYTESPLQDALNVEKMDRHGCIWGDPNADALLDVLCTQGAEKGKGLGPNQLLIQGEDGTFEDVPGAAGLDYPSGRSRSVNWVDYDNDADFDLFIGTELRSGYPNQMFRNDEGSFAIADVGLDDELKTEATAWADWDRDGDLDLIVTVKKARAVAYENRDGRFAKVSLQHVTGRDWLGVTFGEYNSDRWPDLHLIGETRSLVLVNRRGSFEPVHRMPTSQGRTGIWFDVDNDADQDLFVIQGAPGEGDDPDAIDAPDVLLVRDDDGFTKKRLHVTGVRTGNGDSAAVSDHDRDGDLDLFVTNGYKRSAGPFLLLENESEVQNWVAVDVAGGPGDPLGMWAKLKVTTDDGTFWRRITDGFVFRSQSELGYTHVGIGTSTSADVEIRWWDGARDCVTLEASEARELQRATAPCRQQ